MVQLFYAYAFVSRCYFYLPIFILWFIKQGLSQTQIMLLVCVYFVSALLAEIPTGLFADRYGRKWAMLLGSLVQAVGALCLTPANSPLLYVVAELLLGVGHAFQTGAKEAILYDHLSQGLTSPLQQARPVGSPPHRRCAAGYSAPIKEQGAPSDYQSAYAESKFFEFSAMSVGAVCGAPLYIIDNRWPFIATALVFALGAICAVSMREPRRSLHPTVRFGGLKEGFAEIRRSGRALQSLIGYYCWFFSLVLLVTTTLSQPYLRYVGVSLKSFGWMFLMFNVLAMIGTLVSNKLGDRLSGRRFFVSLASGFILVMVILAFGKGMSGAIIFGGVYLGWGLFLPTVSAAVNRLVGSDRRATVLSIQDFFQNGVFVVTAIGVGWVVDHYGLPIAFGALSVVSVVAILVTMVHLSPAKCRSKSS